MCNIELKTGSAVTVEDGEPRSCVDLATTTVTELDVELIDRVADREAFVLSPEESDAIAAIVMDCSEEILVSRFLGLRYFS